ncbi:hypothetical protein [Paenarthrobacter nicotinovorans]|uniref:hypothetical protein n=1 Tax=Paenarthrobacter nicotinovorans TaxID=29320 RepID=UPI00119E32A2|nr:hypothetical protein [Paenarthrobacter nicotinovorans]
MGSVRVDEKSWFTRQGTLAGAVVAAMCVLNLMLVGAFLPTYLSSIALTGLVLIVSGVGGATFGLVIAGVMFQFYSKAAVNLRINVMSFSATLLSAWGLFGLLLGLFQNGNFVGIFVCGVWALVSAVWALFAARRIRVQTQLMRDMKI